MDLLKYRTSLRTNAMAVIVLLTGMAGVHAQVPRAQIAKMGNGLTVILAEDHSTNLAAVDIWVKAGSGNETASTSGVAHFIEHLSFASTAKYGPGEMDLEMESLGASLDARTSKDWARFGVTVMSRYVPQALGILAEAIIRPRFRELDVQKERLVLLEEVVKKQTEPIRICRDRLATLIYGDHPYGLPVEGSFGTLKRITRDDIVSFHKQFYIPSRIAVVLAGDINPESAVIEIGKAFQGLSAGAPPEKPAPTFTAPSEQITKTYRVPYKKEYLGVGFAGPVSADYTDVCTMDLVLTYLGSGYRSWISEELKGKLGLVESGSADFLTERYPGLVAIIVACENDKLQRAKDAILAKLASIQKDGIPQESLALAKRLLLGEYAFQNETVSGKAQSYGFYYAISEPEFAVKYPGCIDAVTNQDVTRVAQKYLDPNRAAILALGPNQKEP